MNKLITHLALAKIFIFLKKVWLKPRLTLKYIYNGLKPIAIEVYSFNKKSRTFLILDN